MALTILDDTMTTDRSPHSARLAPGERHVWEVSWLPGRRLNRNGAITAMTFADESAREIDVDTYLKIRPPPPKLGRRTRPEPGRRLVRGGPSVAMGES